MLNDKLDINLAISCQMRQIRILFILLSNRYGKYGACCMGVRCNISSTIEL